MFGAFINVKTAALPGISLRTILLSWSIAELIAFAIGVKLLGVGGAILLMAASSVLGIVMLRRIGLEAVRRLTRTISGQPGDGALIDGTLAAFGALFLILPGFVSDVVGLALAAPSIRLALRTRIGGGSDVRPASPLGRRQPNGIIDLPPTDWQVVEPSRRG